MRNGKANYYSDRMSNTTNGLGTDSLLDLCFQRCFICDAPFSKPPKVWHGHLDGPAMVFNILDEDGCRDENEERLCNRCWVSSKFANEEIDRQQSERFFTKYRDVKAL